VKFAPGPATSTFVEQINQSYLAPNPKNRPQDKFFTTGSRRSVSTGEEASFTLVVVPHAPEQDAKAIASGISFKETTDGVEVLLNPPAVAVPVRVGLLNNDSWKISREP